MSYLNRMPPELSDILDASSVVAASVFLLSARNIMRQHKLADHRWLRIEEGSGQQSPGPFAHADPHSRLAAAVSGPGVGRRVHRGAGTVSYWTTAARYQPAFTLGGRIWCPTEARGRERRRRSNRVLAGCSKLESRRCKALNAWHAACTTRSMKADPWWGAKNPYASGIFPAAIDHQKRVANSMQVAERQLVERKERTYRIIKREKG
ncbi:hypothetical protein B0H63DRAFT_290114 [Podospora didyma]|uniref:Uncharacterized protein n=1 Tax=Podospora didyma TaxID=330526 RepID=A0AAE0K8S7_9PEZI|nr:hypothetical protein B0H63DRAFT_290114 [Podospora didyma]